MYQIYKASYTAKVKGRCNKIKTITKLISRICAKLGREVNLAKIGPTLILEKCSVIAVNYTLERHQSKYLIKRFAYVKFFIEKYI